MRAIVLAFVGMLACAGCAGPQPAWVPQLVVRGAIVHHQDASTRRDGRGWDWRVEGGLRWPLAQVPRVPRPRRVSTVLAPPAPPPCAHELICAWERRERARAYEAALRRLEEEP